MSSLGAFALRLRVVSRIPLFILFGVAVLLDSCNSGRAAELVALGKREYMNSEIPFYLLKGTINVGDLKTVRSAILLNEDIANGGGSSAIVAFDSVGGSLSEAIEIGRFLSEHMIATIVQKDNSCLSACALAFLGGRSFWPTGGVGPFLARYLEPGGRIGFHSPGFDQETLAAIAAQQRYAVPVEMTRLSLRALIDYLRKSGVTTQGILEVISTPYSSMKFISTPADLFDFNLHTTRLALSFASARDGISAACEKLIAASQRASLSDTRGYLLYNEYRIHPYKNGAFLGFEIEDRPYLMSSCGVPLTADQFARHKANKISVQEIEKTLLNKFARLNDPSTAQEIDVIIAAYEADTAAFRKVGSLHVSSVGWSNVEPSPHGPTAYRMMYPAVYFFLPNDLDLSRLKPARGDWSLQ